MMITDILYGLDILITLRTASFDILTGEEIDRPLKIAKNYLLSLTFVVDLLSCLPWSLLGHGLIFDILDLLKIVRVSRVSSLLAALNFKSSVKQVRVWNL